MHCERSPGVILIAARRMLSCARTPREHLCTPGLAEPASLWQSSRQVCEAWRHFVNSTERTIVSSTWVRPALDVVLRAFFILVYFLEFRIFRMWQSSTFRTGSGFHSLFLKFTLID